jgi:hypothetical protein
MKNQYIADINDYRKYGLLRGLSVEGMIRTGVCWMLTPDDGRSDGKFIQYLESPKKWNHFDPLLFECLSACIRDGDRHVSRIESDDILPNTIFHSDPLTNIPEQRTRYFTNLLDQFRETDLIFFDPDNGLEVKSCLYGSKYSNKYLYWHELKQAFSAGKSVLIYQHFIRERRDHFIARIAKELIDQLSSPEVLSFRTAHVVFFLVPQPKHAPHFEKQADVVAERWRKQIKAIVHRPVLSGTANLEIGRKA